MVRLLSSVGLMALGLAACQGGGSASGPAPASVRPTVDTAPADLQLLCASEAATRYSVASDTVLPVSSSTTGAGTYQVNLTVGGSNATCVVDNNGSIISIDRA